MLLNLLCPVLPGKLERKIIYGIKQILLFPKKLKDQRLLLHFGAVDWQCAIFINDKEIGTHTGGYDPFYFDITDYLKKGTQELVVRVWDPTDDGPQPRGKQVKNPNSIWYTAVTGIWQTVWLETVSAAHIQSINTIADIDNNAVDIETGVNGAIEGDQVKISITDKGKSGSRANCKCRQSSKGVDAKCKTLVTR